MKKLILSNASYRYLEQSFREWLDILGYSPTTIYTLPNQIRELLYYLERQGINHIKELTAERIEQYYQKLKERSNQRRGGGLSGAHLNKHLQALRRFTEYLRKAGRLELRELQLPYEESESKLVYLTEEQIQLLYKTTYQSPRHKVNLSPELQEAVQSRDRAMLSIFYGCGLRRNEGVQLDVGDINFDTSLLHVRKGKNYKERFVPISRANLKHLTAYVYDHRGELLRGGKSEALFISTRKVQRLSGQSLLIRLKVLQYHSENPDLQEKEISLHTLRHSIATHFLQAGMKLESISRFLGHSSLESTQIYTHLSTEEQPYANIPTYEVERLEDE